MLTIPSDVSAGGALTLVVPVGFLLVVLAWGWRVRSRM